MAQGAPFDLRVAANQVSNVSAVNKFGQNPDIDLTFEDLTELGSRFTYPSTPQPYAIVSSSASDAAGDSGCSTLRISGLTSWEGTETYEDLTMNGTSVVTSTNSWVCVHKAFVLTSGVSAVNRGNIDISWSGTTQTRVVQNEGESLSAVYGVGAQDDFYVTDYYASIIGGNNAHADFQLIEETNPGSALNATRIRHIMGTSSEGVSSIEHVYAPPERFEGPALIRSAASVDANNIAVAGGFDGYLVKKGTTL